MSATNDTFGIRHRTVVPTNFESAATTEQPEPDDDDTGEPA
jgi:hypothetical protein